MIIDPLGQPAAKTGRDHCFRTCCPYIRALFKIWQNQSKFATGETVGLAEWIFG